jgi:hypothetical protein
MKAIGLWDLGVEKNFDSILPQNVAHNPAKAKIWLQRFKESIDSGAKDIRKRLLALTM